MADPGSFPGHDNDYHDLASFDDESSVISVSATTPLTRTSSCLIAVEKWCKTEKPSNGVG